MFRYFSGQFVYLFCYVTFLACYQCFDKGLMDRLNRWKFYIWSVSLFTVTFHKKPCRHCYSIMFVEICSGKHLAMKVDYQWDQCFHCHFSNGGLYWLTDLSDWFSLAGDCLCWTFELLWLNHGCLCSIDWLIDWLTDWLNDWLIDWWSFQLCSAILRT